MIRSLSPAPYAAAVSIKVPPASRKMSSRAPACSAGVSRPQVMVPRPSRDTRNPLVPTGRNSMVRDPSVLTMKLGLNLGYLVGSDDPRGQLRLAQHAESLGFSVVWAAEAYGSDSPTVLAWLAAQTTTIDVGSAVMQIPGRTPAMTAMTAASLDVLTGGRFRLGLGVSGPQVSEGWHGVRFSQPLARTREYLGIVQQALSRQTVSSSGTHYPLPLPGGPGKPLKLSIAPVSEHIPTYLAAIGPKNLELAGELTDGWLAVFFAPAYAAEQLEPDRRRSAAGRQDTGGLRRGAHVPAGGRGRSADLCRPRPRVRRPLSRRHGQPAAELLQRSGGADGIRGGRGNRPGPVPDRSPARRPGRGALRVHRRDLVAG